MFAIVFIDISLTFCSTSPLKFWENVKSPPFYYLGENIYSISACVKYLISTPTNFNFCVIPPWLEKNFDVAPLKCLRMPPNCPDMCRLSD